MELSYDTIIKYLSPKANYQKKIEINSFDNINKYELKNFKILNFSSENSLLDSIIYILMNEYFFLNQSKMRNSRNDFIKQVNLNNKFTYLKDICEFFKINILVLSEQINIYSCENIIDLSLPFIILYHMEDHYYPVFKNQKNIFFYHNSEIEDLLDKNFKVNFEDYQFLDDLNQIIDIILKNNIKAPKQDEIFTNNINLQDYEKQRKKTRKILINDILSKNSDLNKSNLNKLKKNDLIELFLQQ